MLSKNSFNGTFHFLYLLGFFVSGEPVPDFSQSPNLLCLITSCSALSQGNSFSPIHNGTRSHGGTFLFILRPYKMTKSLLLLSISMGEDKCLSSSNLMSDEKHCLYVSLHKIEGEREREREREREIEGEREKIAKPIREMYRDASLFLVSW